ncbi:hypothetical protein NE237_029454 [Protea cynaroides]|uniref:AP2/ERF domain-containing protein n=1 Tax=Protea cynaroides TaxID=273540 RepID=A0A9Q0JV40_9MAGN|nr:hypothetical protein NE237_029454 [Protea cynaroides]
MNCPQEEGNSHGGQKRYKGVRCRKWGKWVSEIRVPGTRDRLWLGSYSNPEAAAIAFDTAMFCLRGPSSATHFNFPMCLPTLPQTNMSPKSIRKVASNAAMAVDLELAQRASEGSVTTVNESAVQVLQTQLSEDTDDIPGKNGESYLREEKTSSISVDDMEIYIG